MANPTEQRTGTAYVGQVNLSNPATQPFHALRNDDPVIVALRQAQNNVYVKAGYGPETFGNKDPNSNGHTTTPDGSAVLIGADGRLAVAQSVSPNAFNTFAVKAGNKYYFSGMLATNFGANLLPGKEYWLHLTGAPSITAPTQTGEWAVKLGIAVNSTDLLVGIDVQGQI